MSSPTVSVLVPSYQAQPFLRATLDSVVAQTTADWELVIVDDASTDGSWDIAQRYRADPRVRLIRHGVNRGAAATWNHALSLAAGRYVKLLCSDDLITPDCLERQVDVLEHDPHSEIGLVTARRDIIDALGNVVFRGRGLGPLAGRVDGRRAVVTTARSGTNLIGEPSVVLFRRDHLQRAGGFDGRWRYVIDIMTYARVLAGTDAHCLDATLGSFRVGAHSWSATLAASQGAEFRQMVRDLAADDRFGMTTAECATALSRASVLAAARVVVLRAASYRARRQERSTRTSPT